MVREVRLIKITVSYDKRLSCEAVIGYTLSTERIFAFVICHPRL